ncbi:MAG: alkaline phosphatase family protein [Chloroflexi bacterium]|nr:MAG: alkaline phosphatase family protein [Chloroflexota bacterium]
MRRLIRLAAFAALAAAALVPGQAQAQTQASAQAASPANCTLNNGIKHVISIQFDNTHLFRDRANVPSDLEQMPNLLNFMTSNGTLSDNEHTILISHTAGGILTSLTGLYPDRQGITVSNSYGYFKTGTNATAFSSAFKYWTDKVDDVTPTGVNDPNPNMVTTGGLNTPAPWVPYTRAGCDYGAVSTANVVLENTRTTPAGDMTKVFGANSPEWNEAKATPALAQTDFVGIAVHCAVGGGICNTSTHARPDLLPDEPGGYNNFQALFGAKYVNPAITGGANAVNDTNGHPITDPAGNPGFPGFDGALAKNTLGYIAQMQEAGVPITFAYISDAHDNHTLFRASGPGEADYVQQLHDYDQAFGTFFSRLAADGIDKSNTLFVFTADENDHFAGGNSSDGTWSHTFCNVTGGQTCPANQIGEVTQNIKALVPAADLPPAFDIHFDSAPTVYVAGNPAPGNAQVRQFERDLAAAQNVDPYVSSSPSPVMLRIADPVGQKALHMVNADPQRTQTFTYFANPDYFLTTGNTACPTASVPTCVDYHFAYSHGDVTEDIARTWLGFVGPGVKNLGRTSDTWSDHADIRPTILSLLGLKDSYEPDGAALVDFLDTSAVSRELRAHHESLVRLHTVYKEIAAPFGPFAADTLVASTRAIASGSATDDSAYASTESSISSLTSQRDALEAQMRTALTNATFGGPLASEQQLKSMIDQGNQLLDHASALASAS